jgi:hypothetical protein
MSKVARKHLSAMLGAACMMAAIGSAGARDGTVNAVTQKVQVESREGKVLVRLTFENQSDGTVYLLRSLASDKEPLGNWFEVRDSSNGDPLDYTGPMVKRMPLSKADFVPLKPHARHQNTIDITHSYAFLQGRHAYQLTFAGNYVTDLRTLQNTTPAEPASVMFAYVGK